MWLRPKGAKVVISSPQWLTKNKHYEETQKSWKGFSR